MSEWIQSIRGPALLYIGDDDPPTVTHLDAAEEGVFNWMDRRTRLLIDALITEYQTRRDIWLEDIGK